MRAVRFLRECCARFLDLIAFNGERTVAAWFSIGRVLLEKSSWFVSPQFNS
jgi:hypothetical protein